MHNFSHLYECNAEAHLGPCQICSEAAVQRCSYSAANKFYSSAGHHEQKNKKTGQIKFSEVTIKQQTKLSSIQHSLSQPTFTCSKLTLETLEQGVKYVQS